jgi:hypothetical protein
MLKMLLTDCKFDKTQTVHVSFNAHLHFFFFFFFMFLKSKMAAIAGQGLK